MAVMKEITALWVPYLSETIVCDSQGVFNPACSGGGRGLQYSKHPSSSSCFVFLQEEDAASDNVRHSQGSPISRKPAAHSVAKLSGPLPSTLA